MPFVIKMRSEGRTRMVAAEYHCDLHGRFELDVERNDQGDAPDTIPCPIGTCGGPAVYCISAPMTRVRNIEAAVKGKWQKPERKTWTDTSALGEGQPLYEWKEDRDKVWEEKRKEDVVRFAREHNERVGGD